MIVIRRPVQGLLFGENEGRYTLIATNRTESAEEVVQWYCKRGDSSENRIKDLKIGFGMERIISIVAFPSGSNTAMEVIRDGGEDRFSWRSDLVEGKKEPSGIICRYPRANVAV
jgi:hypothetical protein